MRDLQAQLNAARFNAGPVDGNFGPLTQTAVTAFQSAVGLPTTGVYDTATSATLADYSPPAGQPASHRWVRVPMHIAQYLPSMLPNGTPVEVMP